MFGLSNRETAGQPFLNFVRRFRTRHIRCDRRRGIREGHQGLSDSHPAKGCRFHLDAGFGPADQNGAWRHRWCSRVASERRCRTAGDGKLADLNLLDPLTGLGTREAMVDRLSEELKDPGVRCSILEIHIDHLGRLNEALTFSGGDQVIAAVADRLHRHLGAGAMPSGSPEVVGVILRETETLSQAVVIAERMRTLCGTPLSVGELQVSPP